MMWMKSCFLLVLFASPAFAKSAPPRESAAAPAPAPSFTLPGLHEPVCLDSLRGKVVLVDFWASWCGPCRRSFPWLADLHDRYHSKGLVIVAINVDKKRGDAEDFLGKFRVPFSVAFDPAGKTAEAFHVSGMPSSFVIGSDGKMLFSHMGFDPKKTARVEARIQEALPR